MNDKNKWLHCWGKIVKLEEIRGRNCPSFAYARKYNMEGNLRTDAKDANDEIQKIMRYGKININH